MLHRLLRQQLVEQPGMEGAAAELGDVEEQAEQGSVVAMLALMAFLARNHLRGSEC